MPQVRLSRRTLLRGMGGLAVALPALEIMGPLKSVRAQPAALRRFVLAYGGVSTGAYQPQDQLVPDTEGSGYEVKRALKPLIDLNVRDDVSVVTGLTIPWSASDGEAVPPGGRSRFFHFNTTGPQISGMATPSERDGAPKGPTADQIVADVIAADTQHRVLAYRVQAAAEFTNAGRLSWRQSGDRLEPQDPIVSPRLAYQSLFSGFVPPTAGDPAADQLAAFLLEQRKSVLDFVADETETLLGKLGQADRIRMQRHLEEVRALETRLSAIVTDSPRASCSLPSPPDADPALSPGANWGYNGETERADVMTDLIAMAFACDLSRVASFMITEWKCYMNMTSLIGIDSDMHELTHGAGPLESISDSVAWIVEQWSKLIVKLKSMPEGDGSVLDQTALVLVFEGGHGYDPEGDKQNAAHSTENMAALVAGRAGGLKPGQHVRTSGGHPAQVVLSAMNAVGVTDSRLGQVEGNIPALFG